MKRHLFLIILLYCTRSLFAQEDYLDINFDSMPDGQAKIEAAQTVANAVKQTGNYIESLSELISNKRIPLPVGIKNNTVGYELIVHKLFIDEKTLENRIYATCAFKFKDNNQLIAFEGEASLDGIIGLGASGKLTLIAPVRRDIGRQSTLVVREGTTVSFNCKGIESFDAHLAWITTSDKIISVNPDGTPTGKPLDAAFDAHFEDFDNYVVSFNIDKSFMIKGLDDIIFTVKGATVDQSDTENSGMMYFPDGYFGTNNTSATQKLWKGVAISEASVGLPSFFKLPNSNERIILALREALFDDNGFSGSVLAENVIPSENINKEAWDISLTGLNIGILKNKIENFSLAGDINIPPFGKNSQLPYTAYFNPVEEKYAFNVHVSGNYDFPVLHSTLTLNELSTIQIEYRNREIYPIIDASGKITVNAPFSATDVTKKTFSVPDINFEHLVISRSNPYLQIGYIGLTGNLQSPKLAGFDVALNNIESFNSPDGGGLAFTGQIGLTAGNGISIAGTAGIKLLGDYKNWKFNKIDVDKVDVNYKSNAFSINGGVLFKKNDAVYGDGFRGSIKLNVIGKFNFDAVGVFGKKDDYRYFLADVFYETQSASGGIPIPPVLSLTGFGGGLYQRMQQTGKSSDATSSISSDESDFGQSLSGINYVPDKNVGMGLMATAKFALNASEKAFNAKVGLEMQFNNNGGLNFVQLRGDGAFMDLPGKWGSLANNLKTKSEGWNRQPEKADKASLENKTPENKSNSMLSASMLFEYDNMNDRFNADLSAYLNVANIVKGVGPNDRLGWAKAYIASDKWYFYMGTPSDPLGVKVLNLAQMTGYFMLGSNIPALPPPPDKVTRLLSAEKQKCLNNRNSDKLGSGNGIAFGSAFNINLEPSFLIFYAKMDLGLGAEFMLTDLRGTTCQGIAGTPGINGWFAQGQAWAYVNAGIGLKAKIFGKTKRFEILDLSTAALLECKGPNPFYFAGAVGGQYRILGGLIKGKCNFEFDMGQECKPVGGSPFEEDIIAQLTPGTGSSEVNVFTAPQAVFNVPAELPLTIDEDNGQKGVYRVHLEELTVKYKSEGTKVNVTLKSNNEKTVYMLMPDEPFESRKEVEVYAKVSFQKKEGNNWIAVKDGGKVIYEEKRATFKTGDRPKEILPEHVVCSYPLNRQYNFYPKEYNQGYIMLSQNYSYLFAADKPQGFDQKLRLATADGQKNEKSFSYTVGSQVSGAKMEISFPLESSDFQNDKIYKLSIVNIPQQANASITGNITETTTQMEGMEAGTADVTRRQATGSVTSLQEKEIYAFSFKTSRFNTFAEKIKAFDKKTEGWRDYVEPFVHNIKTNLKNPELFDAYEIGRSNDNSKVIKFVAKVDNTDWYNQTVYNRMYQSQTNLKIPDDKVDIATVYTNKLLIEDEITLNTPTGYSSDAVFCYALPYYCARDMYAAKVRISQKSPNLITADELAILNQNHPPIVFQGNYPVKASYILPGKNIVTSNVDFNMYNPVKP
ncbi:MAG: hypothetical protein LBH32_02200 [Dysgonamonadaceae bacterium]|jgi:hypothetical protein|nr:hypothetical protein [Dysgonamonadaceae bacterium]